MADDLKHYGTPRHSGRYPWGSGGDPYQRSMSFLGSVDKLRKQGVRDTEIAKGYGMKTTELRKRITVAGMEKKAYEQTEAFRLKEKGYSTSAIGRRMGKNESSVRALLKPSANARNDSTMANAKILQDAVDEKGFIDVGAGVEHHMGISKHQFTTAVELLKQRGYVVHQVPVKQLGTGKDTNLLTLAPPGTTWGDVAKNKYKIKMVTDTYSEDGGLTARKVEPPKSISSDRVLIRYAEEGGKDKDGVIELRRGVDDISLNKAKYAQVRILVDDTHYLKGVGIHSDNIPEGKDIVFNTNKPKDTPFEKVLKPITADPDNPFGASIKQFDHQLIRAQRHYPDKNGEQQLSALNIVNEEGTWSKWEKSLASQMLAKQNPALAKQQLDLSYTIAKEEFDEILSLTNPTVRASLLDKFAGQCDSDATHLQAAALPRQANKLLLPYPDMSDTEVYAPGYHDGEKVALIRYPHGGTFEIPILTVNNKQATARRDLGQAIDAIGIHPKVAERLSGADFDGDTVIIIPVDNVKIRSTPPLKGLEDFRPRELYRGYQGMPKMTDLEKGIEMGSVSNLITDMTVKGAPSEEICRAVRHSMVVIDAQKHDLNYKQSEIDHRIGELKAKYQGKANAGAATLLSRSTSEVRPDQRKEKAVGKMTPEELRQWREGKVIYEKTGRSYRYAKTLDNGELRVREGLYKDKSSQMMETDDAFTLVSGTPSTTTPIERIYATYANSMKALAQASREEARMEKAIPYSASARAVYRQEEASLTAKLRLSERNAPLERQAQLIANKIVAMKRQANPTMDREHVKRLQGMELTAARDKVGAGKDRIYIEDREWEAINAGAVTKSFLTSIINNAKTDRVRELATPRSSKGMSPGKVARAKSMLALGHDQADVADVLGVSVSTLIKSIGLDQF